MEINLCRAGDNTDGPKISTVLQVLVWHIEVAIFPPLCTPGVADDEYPFCLNVTNGHNGMAVLSIHHVHGCGQF